MNKAKTRFGLQELEGSSTAKGLKRSG